MSCSHSVNVVLFMLFVIFLILFFYSFGYVEFASVDEAQAVFDKEENFVLDGRSLFIDYGKLFRSTNSN